MNKSNTSLKASTRFVPADSVLKFGYSPSGGIEFDSANALLNFSYDGTPKVDIGSLGLMVRDGNGIVVGHTAQLAMLGETNEFQVIGTEASDTGMAIGAWRASTGAPYYTFAKSRNATPGSFTVVQDNDPLGYVRAVGDDGTTLDTPATEIKFEVDGTPGTNSMPGAIVFSTNARAANVTEALRINSSQKATFAGSVQSGTTSNGTFQAGYNLVLGADPDNVQSASEIRFAVDGSQVGLVNANSALFLNETANTNMTAGLTINQGANDNQILAFKSSDVDHGMSALVETDTFGAFAKHSGLVGGVNIRGYSETIQAVEIEGLAGTEDTTDTTSSNSAIELQAKLKSGSSASVVGATGNMLTIDNSGGNVKFLVKGNGDLHVTNVSAGAGDTVASALDEYDDVQLVRAAQRTATNDIGIAISKWDASLKNSQDTLIQEGVLSSTGDFRIVQRYEDLLGGAIWQNYERHMSLVERVDSLTIELESATKQLQALGA